MLRDYNFRDALHRQVDSIALPPEEDWVPKARTESARWALAAAVVGVIVLAAALAAISARPTESPAAQEPVPATPPARPTVVDGRAGRAVAPLPNLYRNTQSNYNLVLPAWFHESHVSVRTASDADLLDRRVFTARSDADEARFADSQFVPWDLFVEVYQRRDRTVEQWAAALGCNRSGPAGASTCTLQTTRLAFGVEAVVGTRSDPLPGKFYLVERGAQLLVLRYSLGDESNRPQDVTQATLDQIIGSLGLP